MNEIVENVIDEQIQNLSKLKKTNYVKNVVEISNIISTSLKNNGKILIIGNGGSAADAQHFAAELIGRFKKERRALPAITLTTDSSVLTCIGNDFGFDNIFSRQLEGLGNIGDILFCISTSGNSKNVINAVDFANKKGIVTVGLLGKNGGKLKEMCNYNIIIPYEEITRIQEHQIMTIHLICEIVENYFYKNNNSIL